MDARYGIYSDFSASTTTALRFTGKGMAVLTFSPSIKIKAGVWYLDRNEIKTLPAGGICWTPNPDVYFNILFPNPKIAKRLTTWGNTEWWLYVSGDYGGGKWAIKRNNGLPPNPFYPVTNGTLRHVRLQRHPRGRGTGVQDVAATARACSRWAGPSTASWSTRARCRRPIIRPTPCSFAPDCRIKK